jgi:thioredoxin reductase (NADPH)
LVARAAARLHCDETPLRVELKSGESLHTRSVIIATGAQYRKLDVLVPFDGIGVYYAATYVESQRCSEEEVIVIGGANSAGQAATFLARTSRHVHILIRRPALAETMSRYLIRRIEETPNITLHRNTQVVAVEGHEHLEKVTWRDDTTGQSETHPIRHVFAMTGATPNSSWLDGCVATDEKGFVCTGTDLTAATLKSAEWPLARPPYLFETSRPRVFAIGDVRANSVKRVASAVGEGSICIQLVNKLISE